MDIMQNRGSYMGIMVLLSLVCGNIVVKALCYKPEGRGFDTR
jgi:hypothetical protein